MMEKYYYLSIDRGQTGIKAAICDENAEVLFVESCKCQRIQSPKPGYAEQDMNIIWEQTVRVIRELLDKHKVLPETIAAVSFSGQGGGNFLVSKDGKAIYPGVLSLDNRHEEVLDKIENPERIDIPRTISFMRWLKENEPDVFERTGWILGSKDWLRFCMTGKANADMSDTPAPVDYEHRKYLTETLEVAGVPECESMLPELCYASEVCGSITKEAAERTGLLEGTPVAAGAHDMIACSAGAGGNKPGHLTIIMGTLGINIAVADANVELPAPERAGESFTFAGVTKDVMTATTSIGSACNTMNWFLNMLFPDVIKEAESKEIGIFELLEQKLEGRDVTPVEFYPYLMGTFYNSSATAGFSNITACTSREDIVLSMFQGICISMCIEIQKLEKRVQHFEQIYMVGGGSKSNIWGQMFADVLDRPIHICRTSEVGCRGAAICAGIALGKMSFDRSFPMPKIRKTYYPRREYTEKYQKQLNKYYRV